MLSDRSQVATPLACIRIVFILDRLKRRLLLTQYRLAPTVVNNADLHLISLLLGQLVLERPLGCLFVALLFLLLLCVCPFISFLDSLLVFLFL